MSGRLATAAVLLLMAGIATLAVLEIRNQQPPYRTFQTTPEGVMGTSCTLVAVNSDRSGAAADRALQAAEGELRRLEALLSTWIEASPVSRFNAAPANSRIELAPEIVEIFTLARRLHTATDAAFDITARPLIELWRVAAEEDRLPTEEALRHARAASDWSGLDLEGGIAIKSLATVAVDIDGIAKGYAIDRALARLRQAGVDGGMVEIGGDLRLFGIPPEGETWKVGLRSPFEEHPWGEIEIAEGAVCSSGDYARPIEIDGRRLSHILDPRSGRPTTESRTVTVIAPDAATADAWATALSVLGPAGLDLLPRDSGIEAFIVTGDPADYQTHATPGFAARLVWSDFTLDPPLSPTNRPDRPSS